MDFEEIEHLRRHSPAWRLLRADHAPLVLSFLGRVFVAQNVRSIPLAQLTDLLEDELYALNDRLGEGTFPKSAKAYLDDWATPATGWLRVYYPVGSDQPQVDATPAVEKALGWVASARVRSFVGTESRLQTAFELLRQMAYGTEPDDAVRLAELRRRRDEIDREIERVESGDVPPMDATALRDRYQQFGDTARGLLADFREVESNLRGLDRAVREQIAAWAGTKGDLLDTIVGDRHAIADSDQGRSFHAFYDFLLSSQRQTEFAELLERVHAQGDLGSDVRDPRLRTIHYDWLDAGEQVQQTVRQLSEQLRRFLDDQVWLENRRVTELLRRVETAALRLRDHPAAKPVIELAATSPSVTLPMERPLYRPTERRALDSAALEAGDTTQLDLSALVEQVYVDRARLARTVTDVVAVRGQAGLTEVLDVHPLEQGLAELVAYLALDEPGILVDVNESERDRIPWWDERGTARVAVLPRVTFVRAGRAAKAPEGVPGVAR